MPFFGSTGRALVVKRQHYGLSANRDIYLLFTGEPPRREDIDTIRECLNIFEKGLPSEESISGAGEATAAESATAAEDGAVTSEDGQREE